MECQSGNRLSDLTAVQRKHFCDVTSVDAPVPPVLLAVVILLGVLKLLSRIVPAVISYRQAKQTARDAEAASATDGGLEAGSSSLLTKQRVWGETEEGQALLEDLLRPYMKKTIVTFTLMLLALLALALAVPPMMERSDGITLPFANSQLFRYYWLSIWLVIAIWTTHTGAYLAQVDSVAVEKIVLPTQYTVAVAGGAYSGTAAAVIKGLLNAGYVQKGELYRLYTWAGGAAPNKLLKQRDELLEKLLPSDTVRSVELQEETVKAELNRVNMQIMKQQFQLCKNKKIAKAMLLVFKTMEAQNRFKELIHPLITPKCPRKQPPYSGEFVIVPSPDHLLWRNLRGKPSSDLSGHLILLIGGGATIASYFIITSLRAVALRTEQGSTKELLHLASSLSIVVLTKLAMYLLHRLSFLNRVYSLQSEASFRLLISGLVRLVLVPVLLIAAATTPGGLSYGAFEAVTRTTRTLHLVVDPATLVASAFLTIRRVEDPSSKLLESWTDAIIGSVQLCVFVAVMAPSALYLVVIQALVQVVVILVIARSHGMHVDKSLITYSLTAMVTLRMMLRLVPVILVYAVSALLPESPPSAFAGDLVFTLASVYLPELIYFVLLPFDCMAAGYNIKRRDLQREMAPPLEAVLPEGHLMYTAPPLDKKDVLIKLGLPTKYKDMVAFAEGKPVDEEEVVEADKEEEENVEKVEVAEEEVVEEEEEEKSE
eukprot:PLAT899.1.p1 GENE.PLAT899.1~~PLAT899.1.p1  ORF type:complete len:791 (-),score=311.13 PLAT899.1:84-2219(-)